MRRRRGRKGKGGHHSHLMAAAKFGDIKRQIGGKAGTKHRHRGMQ